MPAYRDAGASGGSNQGKASVQGPQDPAAQEAAARKELLYKQEQLERQFADLHDDARMAQVHDKIEEVSAALLGLPTRLGQVRARGYQFKSFLEKDLERLPVEWERTRPQVIAAVERESQRLAGQMARVQGEVQSARQTMSLPVTQVSARLEQSSAVVRNLESDIAAARSTVQGMTDSVSEGIRKVESAVKTAEDMLDELDAASFRLYPGEYPVAMTKGEWLRGKDDEMKGLFFVTDHRMIFEQKEEVVTKRKLLIFTEKKLVRGLAMEAPIGAFTGAQIEKVGGIFKKKVMHLELTAPPAPFARMSLALDGDEEEWKGLLTRAATGDLEAERVAGAEKKEPEALPEPIVMKCSNCGSTLTIPIVKGMKSVSCEYCGTVLRLS